MVRSGNPKPLRRQPSGLFNELTTKDSLADLMTTHGFLALHDSLLNSSCALDKMSYCVRNSAILERLLDGCPTGDPGWGCIERVWMHLLQEKNLDKDGEAEALRVKKDWTLKFQASHMADMTHKALQAFRITANSKVELEKKLEAATAEDAEVMRLLLAKYTPKTFFPLPGETTPKHDGKLWETSPEEEAVLQQARKNSEKGPNLPKRTYHAEVLKEKEELKVAKKEMKLLKEIAKLEKSLAVKPATGGKKLKGTKKPSKVMPLKFPSEAVATPMKGEGGEPAAKKAKCSEASTPVKGSYKEFGWGSAPIRDHKLLGQVKLIQASQKTYITYRTKPNKPFTHLVSVYDKGKMGSTQHASVGRLLFHKVAKYGLSKAEAGALRDILLAKEKEAGEAA